MGQNIPTKLNQQGSCWTTDMKPNVVMEEAYAWCQHSSSFILNGLTKHFQSLTVAICAYWSLLRQKNESPECLFGLRKLRPWFFWWTSPLWTFWHSGSWFTSIVLATSCFLECNGTPRFQPCEDELEEIGPILLQTRKSWAYVLESMLWELIIQSHVWESVKSLWQVRVCLFHLCT